MVVVKWMAIHIMVAKHIDGKTNDRKSKNQIKLSRASRWWPIKFPPGGKVARFRRFQMFSRVVVGRTGPLGEKRRKFVMFEDMLSHLVVMAAKNGCSTKNLKQLEVKISTMMTFRWRSQLARWAGMAAVTIFRKRQMIRWPKWHCILGSSSAFWSPWKCSAICSSWS